jgi:hypothetical protein
VRAQDLNSLRCSDGTPWSVWIVNSSDVNTCSASSTGTAEAHCCCQDGAWAACGSEIDTGGFFKLTGRPGGQAGIGGTAAGDDLVLQSSSGGSNPPILTLDDTAEAFDFDIGFGSIGWWDSGSLALNSTPLELNAGSSPACLWTTGNRIFHDTDCDLTKDIGEEFVDQTGGTSDHGGLTGLGDDDHPQYLALAGRAGSQVASGGAATGENFTLYANATDQWPRLTLTGNASAASRSAVLRADVSSAAQLTVTTDGVQVTPGSTYYLRGGSYLQLNAAGILGLANRLQIGSADTAGSATCLARSGDSLFHDTDCDGVLDGGEDDLSTDSGITVDDDQPDNDSEVPNDITVNSSNIISTASRVQIGSTTSGSAACVTRNASDHLVHDTDCDGTEDAGEPDLANTHGAIWIPAMAIQGSCNGSTVEGNMSGHLPYHALPNDNFHRVCSTLLIPPGLRGRSWDMYLAYSSTTTSCNFVVGAWFRPAADDATPSTAANATPTIAAPSATTDVKYQAVLSSVSTASPDRLALVAIQRQYNAGADTCTGELQILGFGFEVQ